MVWRKVGGEKVVTEAVARLLEGVESTGSLVKATKRAGLSYRYGWGLIKILEQSLGRQVILGKIGGREGGGSRLTKLGAKLLDDYRERTGTLEAAAEERLWDTLGYTLSARNRLKATIVSVEQDGVVAKVTLRTGGPVEIKSLITAEAARELRLKKGVKAEAVIKASEVMVGRSCGRSVRRR